MPSHITSVRVAVLSSYLVREQENTKKKNMNLSLAEAEIGGNKAGCQNLDYTP